MNILYLRESDCQKLQFAFRNAIRRLRDENGLLVGAQSINEVRNTPNLLPAELLIALAADTDDATDIIRIMPNPWPYGAQDPFPDPEKCLT